MAESDEDATTDHMKMTVDPARPMIVHLLSSGYWHVQWTAEIWAQWPKGQMPTLEDFFHHTGTPELLRTCERVEVSDGR